MIKKNFVFGAMLCAGVSLLALSANAATTYKYDENGNLIEKNDGYTKYVYNYNSAGKMISYLYHGSGATNPATAMYEYTYDTNGNQTSQLYYSCSGGTCNSAPSNKYEYTYNSNGDKTELYYNSSSAITSNAPSSKKVYTYDSNGNNTELFNYSCSNGTCNENPSSKYGYTYDTDGNKTSYLGYSCSGGTCSSSPNYKETYTYDANGNQLTFKRYPSSSYISSNNPDWSKTFTYNDDNLVISETTYDATAPTPYAYSTATYSYELDDYDNVLKKYRNNGLWESYEYADAQAYANKRLGIEAPASCDAGYALIDNACVEIKTHFTIQEADALTTNDNNNWVEWTFE